MRANVVSGMRGRVEKYLTSTLSDADCVSVCIAAKFPRDRNELFGVILNNYLRKQVSSCADDLAIRSDEWATLFGKDALFVTEKPLHKVLLDTNLSKIIDSIQDALRCSLTEQGAKSAWEKKTSRVSCFLALYSDCTEELVSLVLGGLVRADTRRIDDVRSTTEDEDTDHMLLCTCIISIANCVTTGGNLVRA